MSRESDFIHRTLGLTVPESDGGETMLVELTPKSIRLRKRFLTEIERKRAQRGL